MATAATLWALWMVRERPLVAAGLALACGALFLIGLRMRRAPAVGLLQVDDLGRVFWSGTEMRVERWQRAERSVWIQLSEPARTPADEQLPAARQVHLTASSHACTAETWAALQRWLVWLERGGTA